MAELIDPNTGLPVNSVVEVLSTDANGQTIVTEQIVEGNALGGQQTVVTETTTTETIDPLTGDVVTTTEETTTVYN